MLKLVINNTLSSVNDDRYGRSHNKEISAYPEIDHTFVTDIQEISQDLYTLRAHDFDHKLSSEIALEFKHTFMFWKDSKDNDFLTPVIVCHFPDIHTLQMNESINWDEYLQGSLLIMFQLKILKHLLLFCEDKRAIYLKILISDSNWDYVDIYRPFSTSSKQIHTSNGLQTETTISTCFNTINKVTDFMATFEEGFYQDLWRYQKSNHAFRKYLLDHSIKGPSLKRQALFG